MTIRPGPAAIVTILLGFGGAFASAAGPASRRADLHRQLDRLIASRVDAALARPLSNAQGGIAWGDSYTLAALAEMLDATRDPKYADMFVKLADQVAAARDDRHGRKDEYRNQVVPAWGSTKYTNGKWHVWAVHTGMITAPMARFAVIIRRDPKLAAKYAEAASRFVQVAQEAIAVHDGDYRSGPGPDEGYLHGVSTGRNLPLNMQNALAVAWMYLDDATGTTRHRDRTERLARFFKNRLRKSDNGAYVWAYRPPLDGPDTSFEDVSHATINVAFATLCFEHNIVFSREDIDRFVKTLLINVLRPDGTASNNVGGTGGVDKYSRPIPNWGRLARYNETVRERLMSFCRSGKIPESDVNPIGLAYLVTADRRTSATAPAEQR